MDKANDKVKSSFFSVFEIDYLCCRLMMCYMTYLHRCVAAFL